MSEEGTPTPSAESISNVSFIYILLISKDFFFFFYN